MESSVKNPEEKVRQSQPGYVALHFHSIILNQENTKDSNSTLSNICR